MFKKCNFLSIGEMAAFIEEEELEFLDACFVDPLGLWHHCSFTAMMCKDKNLAAGFAFDGSSIPLFSTVDASDLLMKPDYSTCWLDPFEGGKVMHVTCSVYNADGTHFAKCPRSIALKSNQYLKETRIADTACFGPEIEFFVFDDVRYVCTAKKVSVEVDHKEAAWNTDLKDEKARNLGHRMPSKSWYLPVSPVDEEYKLRHEMVKNMMRVGFPIEKHHHEISFCQHEINLMCKPLLQSADLLMSCKYVVKNTAKSFSKTATFMPKPMYSQNGSGMHCHQSLWKNGNNLFFNTDDKFAQKSYMKLSEMAMYYIGGLLKHAYSVLAFTNPTCNSYKRLVPGYKAPSTLIYSKGDRTAAIRIPLTDSENPEAKRVEFRCPDASACPYLAFAAMLMAGLDGIKNKTWPGEPFDNEVSNGENKIVPPCTPKSLEQAIDALENDHDFLTAGNVFSKDFIKSYIDHKRDEINSIKYVPHPKEFELYYHC